jgi:hypothetical protein
MMPSWEAKTTKHSKLYDQLKRPYHLTNYPITKKWCGVERLKQQNIPNYPTN